LSSLQLSPMSQNRNHHDGFDGTGTFDLCLWHVAGRGRGKTFVLVF
jgi:hypothetical protein